MTDRGKRLLISVIASIVLFVFGVMLLAGGVGSRELLLIAGFSIALGSFVGRPWAASDDR